MLADGDRNAAPSSPTLAHWPAQAALRSAAAEAGRPCLLVVERGADIPLTGDLEDWIFVGASERDVARRLEDLAAAAERLDIVGPRPVVVLPRFSCRLDARVARALLAEAGHLVARTALTDDELDDAGLDACVGRVRRALARSGWTVHRAGRRGFVAMADLAP